MKYLAFLVMAGCSSAPSIGPDTHAYEADSGHEATPYDPPSGDDASPAVTPEAGMPEAMPGMSTDAGQTGPVSVTEQCVPFTYQGTTYNYAEHQFSGVSSQQLASVVAVANVHLNGPMAMPAGYTQAVAVNLLVRDGYVAVVCGSPPNVFYDSVTFTLLQ